MAVGTARGLFLAVLLAGAVLAAGQPVAAPSDSHPVATDVRLAGDESQTRFILDLSRKIDLHAFTLADPYRVVLDIPEVIFKLPPKAGETGRGLIKAFRFGLMMEGGSRIVFDVTKPVRIDKALVMDPAAGDPARLVLVLSATERESFLRKIALDDKASAKAPTKTEPQAANGDTRPVLVLDPGHGGIDTGTRAPSGEMEKDIVLDVAQRVRARIEKSGKYRVVMTRTDDTFIPLAERVDMARKAEASLFFFLILSDRRSTRSPTRPPIRKRPSSPRRKTEPM